MKIKLSQLVTKVPSAYVEITNIDLTLHETSGLVLLECVLLAGKGEEAQSLASLQLPAQLSTKELLELFSVTKVAGNTRRRLK